MDGIGKAAVQHSVENDLDHGLLTLGTLIACFQEYDCRQLLKLLVGHVNVYVSRDAGGRFCRRRNLLSFLQIDFQKLHRRCNGRVI